MAHLLTKRSFAGVSCAAALAANVIIRSRTSAIVLFILSLPSFFKVSRECDAARWLQLIISFLLCGLIGGGPLCCLRWLFCDYSTRNPCVSLCAHNPPGFELQA